MPLKIKDKKILWTKLCFRQFYNEKIRITWGLFVDKGSGSGIFPDPDLDPGDQKRPDPTGSGSGSATLVYRNRNMYSSRRQRVKNRKNVESTFDTSSVLRCGIM